MCQEFSKFSYFYLFLLGNLLEFINFSRIALHNYLIYLISVYRYHLCFFLLASFNSYPIFVLVETIHLVLQVISKNSDSERLLRIYHSCNFLIEDIKPSAFQKLPVFKNWKPNILSLFSDFRYFKGISSKMNLRFF